MPTPSHAVSLRVQIVPFPFDLHSAAVFESHIACHAHAVPLTCSGHAVLKATSLGHGTEPSNVWEYPMSSHLRPLFSPPFRFTALLPLSAHPSTHQPRQQSLNRHGMFSSPLLFTARPLSLVSDSRTESDRNNFPITDRSNSPPLSSSRSNASLSSVLQNQASLPITATLSPPAISISCHCSVNTRGTKRFTSQQHSHAPSICFYLR